ncbi:MAG: acid phosphatase [Candidatus Omnitrophica bacterium]|nr:acid phosphatase [Candidatus Omnitrophota bacterium]MDE2223306.1 acid phosphatase [Candidatus Omnitrophota bacterium]
MKKQRKRLMMPLSLLLVSVFFSRPAWARPDHVVVVIEENKSYNEIIGNKQAAYINELAEQGALMTRSYAVTHPSLPNYLALFSGSTHGVEDDGCQYVFQAPNLAQNLQEAGMTFKTFAESMPQKGFDVCRAGVYAKKHNPAAYFLGLDKEDNRPFRDFPKDFSRLPSVAFVIPNLDNDMHDGSVAQADEWLRKNLGAYAVWAKDHDSLLILTWDEDDNSPKNQIPTIIFGAHVKPGRYSRHIDHYDVLKTLADLYGVPAPGQAQKSRFIDGIWNS